MAVKVRVKNGVASVVINWKKWRKSKRIGVGKEAEKEARAVAAKIQAKLVLGDLSILAEERKPVTFADYAKTWLAVYATVHCKASSVEEYTKALRLHLVPAFGKLPLPEITRELVKQYLAEKLARGSTRWRGKPLGKATVHGHLVVLREILYQAVDDGLLASNPAARLGKFAKRRDRTAADRLDVFTAQELAHLLDLARRELPAAYPPVLTLATSGLRESELFGLQREDLDLTRQSLGVHRAISRGRLGTPKNGKDRRVDLPPQTCQVLAEYLTRTEAEAVLAGHEPLAWLFPKPDGKPMDRSYLIRHLWEPLLDRAGLRRRGPHQLRHTYASLLIAQGAHPKYIQEQLGHHSIQMTMDIYGHLFEGDHRRYVEALDHVLDATARNARATGSPAAASPALLSSR